MKADQGVAKIKFCYPMFACEESSKACEESDKACVESGKAPWKYLIAFLSEKDFLEKDFFALLKIVY